MKLWRRLFTIVAVVLLFSPILIKPAASQPGGLEQAWQLAQAAGAYRFTAEIEQTLIPRPLPSMLGQTDQRLDMQVQGEVTLPDYARLEMRFEGGTQDIPPISLVQDGAKTYLLKQDGERLEIENPLALSGPTSDYLGYLAAVKNIRLLDEPAPQGFTRYAYDLDGPRMAAYVSDQLTASMQGSLPSGLSLSPSPVLQRMTGRGELWVDADGLPRRQVLDLELPEASPVYDSRAHIVVDFSFEGAGALAGSTTPGQRSGGLDANDGIVYALGALLLAAVAVATLAYPRRRWVYGVLAVAVVAILAFSPPLQGLGYARFQESLAKASPPVSLAEALGLPAESAEPAAQPASGQPEALLTPSVPLPGADETGLNADPPLQCGDGDQSADSDTDGLNDAAENCLGSDPFSQDSDRDLISDTQEIDGFSFGGKTWTSDPLKPDSNNDGLNDGAEWPAPLGYAPDLGPGVDAWDPDGDGVPNLWDPDNDGDGLTDNLDLSPFSLTAYAPGFSVSTQGAGFDGYQYIELQIQPQNEAQLRYSNGVLDWPIDSKGQITDTQTLDWDIRLVPMLRIHANQAPAEALATYYGVTVFEEAEGVTLLAPLTTVGDGGQIAAFSAKLAYGPGQLEDLRLQAEVIWMALRNEEAGEIEPALIQTYPGGAFRVSGLQITKSRGFQSAILGTPGSPDDDRQIYQLLLGLSATFLNNQHPDLAELQERFGNPNTDLVSTWGVPAAEVTIDLAPPYGHMDAGLFGSVMRAVSLLGKAYPDGSTPSLITAYQQEVGSYTLDDGGQYQAGSDLGVNLGEVPLSTSRGLKAESFTRSSSGWRAMTLKETLDMLPERYADLSATLADLQPSYPKLTAENLVGVLDLFYASWYLGQARQVSLDGQSLLPVSSSDLEVYNRLTRSQASALAAFLLETAQLGQAGAGLRIGGTPAATWSYRQALGGQADELGYLEFAANVFGITASDLSGSGNLDVAEEVLNSWDAFSTARDFLKAAKGIRGIAGAGEAASGIAKAAKTASKASKVMKVIGVICDGLDFVAFGVSIGLAIYEYTQMKDMLEKLPEGSGLREDLKTSNDARLAASIVTYSIVLFLSLGPWGVIGMIIGFLDLILSWMTGEGFLDEVVYGFQRMFGGVTEVLTFISELSFTSPVSDLQDPELGLVAGNTFQLKSTFSGVIGESGEGSYYAIRKSAVAGLFAAGAAPGEPVITESRNGDANCSVWYPVNIQPNAVARCQNSVQADYKLLQAKLNVALSLNAGYTGVTYHEFCSWFDCDEKTDYWYEWGEPTTIDLDVLPPSLDGLWGWAPGGSTLNLDHDGDGLKDGDDPYPDAWDGDGDGLSDQFEPGLGANPDDPDSDGDDLPDGFEFRLGTALQASDSDNDGLLDCQEANFGGACLAAGPWAAGWLVSLPGRTTPVRVYSDPLGDDRDGDGLLDGAERAYGTSPFAYNDAPRLKLEVDPLATSPGGETAAYLKAGDLLSFNLTLTSSGPQPVTSTLALCLPAWLTDLQGGTMQGDRTPPVQIASAADCPGGQGRTWSFAGANTLQLWESVSATLTARVLTNLSSSVEAEAVARLPYQLGTAQQQINSRLKLVADADNPQVAILAPSDGALLGGGAGFYVTGGTAGDDTTWIDRVELDLPAGGGTVSAEGTGLWAYTWQLPPDGAYTLRARAYDQVGHASPADTVQVTVDNTPPGVSLDWSQGEYLSVTAGDVYTVTLTGGASDNLSGLARVQVSTDGRPWREVWAGAGGPASASWSTDWRLAAEASAQGEHVVSVRAWDLAGNLSPTLTRSLLVDVVPPTDELTNRTYLLDPPQVPAGQNLTLHGVANDAGRLPLTTRPAELVGRLDAINDATIWLGLPSEADDDAGLKVAWLGDFNGDRLADLVVGLPGADPTSLGSPSGLVSIVYGRAGGWPVPAGMALLSESRSSFVGQPGAGLGEWLAAPGDVNGDGFSDLLVGDPAGQRLFLIYGRTGNLGGNLSLDGPQGKDWAVIDLAGLGDLVGLAAVGDVNGDGYDDLLVGTRGPDGTTYPVYLLLGKAGGWRETVSLARQAAAVVSTQAWDSRPGGLGDLDRDGYDEFAITGDNHAYLFPGNASYRNGGRLALDFGDAYDFANAMHPAAVAALGDVNGDGYADFIMASMDTPRLVYGDANLGDGQWTTHTMGGLTPPASGFLGAPGDVDADGLADLLVGNADGDAYLFLGADVSQVAATFSGVAAAASVPYAAGADLNSDGSSDLLLVPSTSGAGLTLGIDAYGQMPYIDPAWLPVAPSGVGFDPEMQGVFMPAAPALATMIVDDDGCPGCYTSIQEAVNVASPGDQILVQPGVYGSFVIDGKDDLLVSGVHPDAVFVDGAGGEYAARIANASGVRLSDLTLRDAQHGLWLEAAGVGGYAAPALKITLERLLVHSFSENALYMDRTSAVALSRCTLAGGGQSGSAHIEVYGPADPALDANWMAVSTTITATRSGGGLAPSGQGLFLLPGDGSQDLYHYDPNLDGWQTAPSVPVTVTAGTVAAGENDGSLHLVLPKQWTALGVGFEGGGDNVQSIYSLAVDVSGYLYAGGNFTTADGQPIAGIARWDGSAWSALGSGIDGDVNALAMDGSGNLYVGGYFTTAGGLTVNNIAMWDGSQWSALGSGVNSQVNALAMDGSGNLYAGGYFTIAGGQPAYHIAKWNGSTWSGLGSGIDYWIYDLAMDGGGNLYAGGYFTSAGGVPVANIARWNGSAWSALGSGIGGSWPNVYALAVDGGGNLYAGGDFDTAGGVPAANIARWDGSQWSALGGSVNNIVEALEWDASGILYAGGYFTSAGGLPAEHLASWDGSAWTAMDTWAGESVESLLADGQGSLYAGLQIDGAPTQNVGRWSTLHYRYDHTGANWSELALLPENGLALAGDGSGHHYALVDGDQPALYRYDVSGDSWSLESFPPFSPGEGSALAVAGQYLYALPGGTAQFWRYDRVSTQWAQLEQVPAIASAAAGAALAWDGSGSIYALAGGNGQQFLRFDLASGHWQVLGDGNSSTPDMDTPAPVNAGGGLAFAGGQLYFVPGGDLPGLWRYPRPEKLALDQVAFVAPATASDPGWLTIGGLPADPANLPSDFGLSGSNNAWVAGSSTIWSPAPFLEGSSLLDQDQASFLDPDHDVYRLGSASTLAAGYHTYRPEAVVATSGEEFTSLQAAINSGANRVLVRPGNYQEPVYLLSGVQIAGAGAGQTILSPPPGNTASALARAEGVAGASLTGLTLAGDGLVDGLLVEDGAGPVTASRLIIHGAADGIQVDGSDSDLEVANLTLAGNFNGLLASGCAGVDVRNTIFAYQGGTGLSYASCAPSQLHNYNDYWANGADIDDGSARPAVGPGELFLDPLFVDLLGHDYRTLDVSPVIDAGDPGDPAPPGTGGRVDIGYLEQGRAAFYADDDYCEFCPNDGLTWQVDAFDQVQAALGAAALDLGTLRFPEVPPQYTVGVGPGAYSEALSVPSYVRLVGSGAEGTILDAGGAGNAVTFSGVVQAGIHGFTIQGASAAGVAVLGAANAISVTRNLILDNPAGVVFSESATGQVTFNTMAGSLGPAISSQGAGAWVVAESNLLAANSLGLQSQAGGLLFHDYNLLDNITNFAGAGLSQAPGELVNVDPAFAGGAQPYRLSPASPAVDTASPNAAAPPGGGDRADMGYSELLAPPLALFLGKQGLSTTTGNSGVAEVQVGITLADPSQPVTVTLPAAWQPVSLASPGSTASYWQLPYLPGVEGYYRVYSRASDLAANQETQPEDWYEGAFVADSAAPVVTWLAPADGTSMTSPLELRAEAWDYPGGLFGVQEVHFVVDSVVQPAQWAAEPWQAGSGQARVFRSWLDLAPGAHTVRAVAQDRAGHIGQSALINLTVTGASPPDATPPLLTVSSPIPGTPFNQTVDFAGTASDAGSGLASVQVSLDGGATWLPAAVSGGQWSLSWEVPGDRDSVSYPAKVAAEDHAGNITVQNVLFTVDNLPPEWAAGVDFSIPEGSHLDAFGTLTVDWHSSPLDGSGNASLLLAADQITGTLPTQAMGGTSTVIDLDASGPWYLHMAVSDPAGNQRIQHFGPWQVGTFAETSLPFNQRRQSIRVDGYLDIEHNEWRVVNEFLDDDESERGSQSLYATWDGETLYLGWQGAWWVLDGTLWVYLATGAAGTNQPVQPISGMTTLPLQAAYAVMVTGRDPADGALWAFTGGSWQQLATPLDFAHGSSGGTEIRVPLSSDQLSLVALAVDDDGWAWSVFPTVHGATADRSAASASEQLSTVYAWGSLSGTSTPNQGQPKGTSLGMSLSSPQAPQAAWGPGDSLTYVIELTNREARQVDGLQLALNASPGLAYHTQVGATCASCTAGNYWLLNVPALGPQASHPITVTGQVDLVLGSTAVVTNDVALQLGSDVLAQAAISHRVDGQPPLVEVNLPPGNVVGRGLRTISGVVSDQGGSGVAQVSVDPQGPAGWQTAAGTHFWTAQIDFPNLPNGQVSPFTVAVRATDAAGNWSQISPVFNVDAAAPVLTFSVPVTLTGEYAALGGTVQDPLPAGSWVAGVEVQLDDATSPWLPASTLLEPDAAGDQAWTFTWLLPTEDNLEHLLRARVSDMAGNQTLTGWRATVVDNVAPQITVTTVPEQIALTDVKAAGDNPLLAGTASDGAGVGSVSILVYTPDGSVYREAAQLAGTNWQYLPVQAMNLPGTYVLRVEATDINRNLVIAGPFNYVVAGSSSIYLPIVQIGLGSTDVPAGIVPKP